MTKYKGGGTANPKLLPRGEKGISNERPTIPRQVAKSQADGLLKKKGVLEVRITNTTNISVAIDSINQPV